MNLANLFEFKVYDRVRHNDADNATYVVTRRWLDVDAPEGQQCFYELQDEKPLFGQGKVGPCLESELTQIP